MEEFRPWLADRLAVTLINRQQIGPGDFRDREGGAVEFTEAGRKAVIKAYQERKQDTLAHPLLDQNLRVAQLPFVQARYSRGICEEMFPTTFPSFQSDGFLRHSSSTRRHAHPHNL